MKIVSLISLMILVLLYSSVATEYGYNNLPVSNFPYGGDVMYNISTINNYNIVEQSMWLNNSEHLYINGTYPQNITFKTIRYNSVIQPSWIWNFMNANATGLFYQGATRSYNFEDNDITQISIYPIEGYIEAQNYRALNRSRLSDFYGNLSVMNWSYLLTSKIKINDGELNFYNKTDGLKATLSTEGSLNLSGNINATNASFAGGRIVQPSGFEIPATLAGTQLIQGFYDPASGATYDATGFYVNWDNLNLTWQILGNWMLDLYMGQGVAMNGWLHQIGTGIENTFEGNIKILNDAQLYTNAMQVESYAYISVLSDMYFNAPYVLGIGSQPTANCQIIADGMCIGDANKDLIPYVGWDSTLGNSTDNLHWDGAYIDYLYTYIHANISNATIINDFAVKKNITVAGNFRQVTGDSFINVPYGEMWNKSDTGFYKVQVVTQDVYAPIKNLTIGNYNEFTCDGMNLTALKAGTYKISGTISILATGNSEFGLKLYKNVAGQNDCYSHSHLANGEAETMSFDCIVSLSAGDEISLWIDDHVNPPNKPTVKSTNLNAMRIGY